MGLTDTSRGADSLVCLIAISNKIISQKLNMILLPWVYIKKKKDIKYVNTSYHTNVKNTQSSDF